MKKIILSAALLAGLAFASCSKDDGNDDNRNRCFTCNSIEICEGDNGNAYLQGQDTGVDYDSVASEGCE